MDPEGLQPLKATVDPCIGMLQYIYIMFINVLGGCLLDGFNPILGYWMEQWSKAPYYIEV
ncbi:MAG: hypothetical protein QXE79_02160 [Candidatus Bathyarchaeia archaeon]